MALNKQQLEVVNQTNFPDNNANYITPALLRDFNTDMIDAIQLTGSYAVTSGSNTFQGNQTIIGDLTVTGTLTVPVIHTIYETASVIYSSGSNQFGDELTDTQTLSGSVKVQGSLTVNGTPVLTSSAQVTGFVTTSSFNAYTASNNQRVGSLEVNSASVNTSITNLNTFTASQSTLNGTFATTGSNTFTGNQIIDKTKALYTNALYWTSSEVGYTNLEIINQGGGNLDFASLNGGRMRVVNTPLQLTGSTLSSNSDISTSANIYAANLTGSTINTGSLVTTSSFNAYTQSNDQRVSSLEVNSASVNISISNINTATASLFTSASLALTTASLSGQTLTFTKGNGTTFGIVIPDVSGSDITALNAFTASQLTINTGYNTFTQSAQQSINSLNASSASQQISIDNLNTNSASVNISISNLNSFSQSAQISINSLNGATSSYANSASVALVDANQQSQINQLIAATGSYLTASIDITALNSFTASQLLINTGYNTFTSSANQRLSSLETTSASVNISVSALNTFTASQSTASIVTSINNLNTFSASALVSINQLNQNSASVNSSISNINQFTQSAQISINSINAVSSSWITESETASFARTNVDNNFTANQTFTNITATSASITYLTTLYETASVIYSSGSNQLGDELTDVQTLSGSVKVQGSLTINGTPVLTSSVDISGLVTTASFNAYTQSNDQKVTALETNSASVNTSITNINSTTASLNTSVTNLNQFTASQSTASLVTSITNLNTFSASALVSISNLNSTTASLNTSVSNLNTFSASTQTSINALNTFTASQSTASLVTSINNLNTFSASALVSISNLNSATSSLFASASLSLITASFDNGTRNLTFTKGDTTQFSVNIPDVSGSTNFVTTSSFNQYTQSNDQRVSSLETNSASVNISISNINSTTASLNTSVTNLNASSASQQVSIDALNQFTASQSTASIVNSITELNTFSASALVSISNLNASSASQQISIDNLNTNSASVNTSITNINSATASLFTSTSLSLVTASFNNGTRDLTFTKGDNTTFAVNIPDVSGSAGNFVTTSSFNSYTSSNDQKVNSLISATGSYATTGSNTFVGEQRIYNNQSLRFANQGTFSGDSGSRLSADSQTGMQFRNFSNNDMLFEQNGTASLNFYNYNGGIGITGSSTSIQGVDFIPFSASLNTRILATTINTGSFATTGSNTFTGINTFTNEIRPNTYIRFPNDATLYGNSGSRFSVDSNTGMQFRNFTTSEYFFEQYANAQMLFYNRGGERIEISGSATRIQDVDFIPFSASLNTRIASSLVTASFSGNTLTFTKGDASTFGVVIPDVSGSTINTGSFATTGSNTFIGNQNLDGKLTISGSDNNQIFFQRQGGGDILRLGVSQNGQTFELGLTGSVNKTMWLIDNQGGTYINTFDAPIIGTSYLNLQGALTASLQQGYVWVGNSSNVSSLVATSSFGGTTNTGSLMVTGSIAGNILTFTKGDASTFNLTIPSATGSVFDTGSFATTGSNTFTGNQLINKNGGEFQVTDPSNPSYGTTAIGISGASGGLIFKQSGSVLIEGSAGNKNLTFYGTGSFVKGIALSDNDFIAGATIRYDTTNDVIIIEKDGAYKPSLNIEGGLTASLENGYAWVGNASGRTVAVATSSFGGGGGGNFATTGSNTFTGDQTINGNIRVQSGSVVSITGQATDGRIIMLGHSGSLLLSNNSVTSTYASLSHISSSAPNGNTNLIFKTNSNTGTTIISGSGNIFTNPSNPNTGYIKYIGGSNNLYLNSSSGLTTQITASATSVSGNRPTMNNNIFANTSDFLINQSVNPGSGHTYSNNLYGGSASSTINATAFTGSLTISNNINYGTLTITAASASNNEITGGFSGSHTINVTNNTNNGTMTITTNRNQASNITQNYTGNILNGNGSLTITNQSSSVAVNAIGNIAIGTMTYSNAGALGLGLHRTAASIQLNYGALNLIASASAISAQNNISPAAMSVTNRMYSGSFGSGSLTFNANQIQGAQNTYVVSGSYNGTSTGPVFSQNAVFGLSNTFFTNVEGRGNYVSFSSNTFGGSNLIFTGSQNNVTGELGGGHFGRYNANDGIRNTTGENIFSVGTGTSTTRKTGFLIDSGSNTFVEGTLNVSGSTTLSGSLYIQSGSTLPSATGSSILTWNPTTGQVSQSPIATLISSSFSVGAFNSTITQSGSAAVSQSMTFNNTDISNGVSIVSNSQITLANTGTYNIQFSAQLLAGTGADTIWIWLKKNGTNVSNTATKLVLRNNEADVAAWNFVVPATASDYFELVWQSLDGHVTLLTEAASGNYPAIPSIIVTVTQVE